MACSLAGAAGRTIGTPGTSIPRLQRGNRKMITRLRVCTLKSLRHELSEEVQSQHNDSPPRPPLAGFSRSDGANTASGLKHIPASCGAQRTDDRRPQADIPLKYNGNHRRRVGGESEWRFLTSSRCVSGSRSCPRERTSRLERTTSVRWGLAATYQAHHRGKGI